ncbi:Cu-Zn family superoxide dismutase [Kineosphaera limosa]|uniref:Superoxide dismutase [Cu-Zn] n=1 Tax=Kineosphaera limosa NBRC 100340 TaxID=1184609 RepID=K6W9V5_9MICO|nr:superoxide dismutase family protein [Kineosphaera limosa]NYE02490.1 Cu-Zn family superoxide dismutase [Kineosphaera limosa]GAB95985.1 superoxide dismutase [Kineosphaera limosa NBRC 100340]
MRQPRRRLALPALAVAGMFALSACGDVGYTATYVENRPTLGAFGHGGEDHGPTGPTSTGIGVGQLADAQGTQVGTVELSQTDKGVEVTVEAHGLQPGFHGLHVHAVGQCEAPSANPADATDTGPFLSAGPHLAGPGADHPAHAGDLPPLLVNTDGTAYLQVVTERLTSELLFDADGSAVILHGSPDNFANIPTRYAAGGADEETRKAGDAGQRVACAVIEQSDTGDEPAGAGH